MHKEGLENNLIKIFILLPLDRIGKLKLRIIITCTYIHYNLHNQFNYYSLQLY